MATTINPYLAFDRDCEAAVKFYGEVLNAKVEIMRMGDNPGPAVPPEAKNLVMHATVKTDSLLFMASDSMPGQPFAKGSQVSLSLNFTDKAEQTRVWEKLSAGGKIGVPLADQFWGRFGMLTDRFGINWMLNLEAPKK